MPLRLTPDARLVYGAERRSASAAADPAATWHHLERAHIVAQPFAVAHVGSHVAMLRQGALDRDVIEVLGQLLRVLVAAPPSLLGRYPTGNTGRARMGLRAELPVPSDLAAVLPDDGVARLGRGRRRSR